MEIFFELGILIIAASVIAYFTKLLKQPMVPAYILTGLLLGPIFSIVTNRDLIVSLSEIGIAFLLFMVGLEIDISKLKDVAGVATLGTAIQVVLVGGAGLGLSLLLGFDMISSFYIGLVLAFSSTMVVIKILSDKKELTTLHGRIIIGMLLMQDIFAILALSVMTSLDNFSILLFFISILKGVLLALVVVMLTLYVFPFIFRVAAKSQELLFIMALSVCFLFSIMFNKIGEFLLIDLSLFINVPPDIAQILIPGFSIAIGAFIAGLSLAQLPYKYEIEGKITPLKDFFAILFFVSLGIELNVSALGRMIFPLLIFLVVVILIKPLIIIAISSFFGYKKRTSFFTGAYLSQVSEFSMIIVMQGMSLGQIPSDIFSLTVVLAVVSIAITSYSDKLDNLYSKISGYFRWIDKIPSYAEQIEYVPEKEDEYEVILIGYDRIGYSVFNKLKKVNKSFLVIDYNPEVIKKLAEQRVHSIYGDISDPDVLERIDFSKAKFVICTTPGEKSSMRLIRRARAENKRIIVFVTAQHVDDALKLYDEGADYVILPHFLGGDHVSLMLEDATRNASSIITRKIKNIKEKHIKELNKRRISGHHKYYHSI
ncbi:MAG: cation:proton antiporter [Candidatus Woesearchaeota archaeon]